MYYEMALPAVYGPNVHVIKIPAQQFMKKSDCRCALSALFGPIRICLLIKFRHMSHVKIAYDPKRIKIKSFCTLHAALWGTVRFQDLGEHIWQISTNSAILVQALKTGTRP